MHASAASSDGPTDLPVRTYALTFQTSEDSWSETQSLRNQLEQSFDVVTPTK